MLNGTKLWSWRLARLCRVSFSTESSNLTRKSEQLFLEKQALSALHKIIPQVQKSPNDSKGLEALWKICEIMIKSFDKESWKLVPKPLISNVFQSLKMIDGHEQKSSLLESKLKSMDIIQNEEKVQFASAVEFKKWAKMTPSLESDKLHLVLAQSLNKLPVDEYTTILRLAQDIYKLDYTLLAKIVTKKYASTIVSDKAIHVLEWIANVKVSGHERLQVLNCLITFKQIDTFHDCRQIVSEFSRKLAMCDQETYSIMIRKLPGKEAAKLVKFMERSGLSTFEVAVVYIREKLQMSPRDGLLVYNSLLVKSQFLQRIVGKDEWIVDSLFMAACLAGGPHALEFSNDLKSSKVEVGTVKLTSGITHLCRSGYPDAAKEIFKSLRSFQTDDQGIHKEVFAITEAYIRDRKLSFAFEFVKYVQDQKYPIGRRVHVQLLAGLIQQGQVEKALEWFIKNCKTNDVKLFNTLLQGFVDYDQDKKILMLVENSKDWKVNRNDQTNSILISWYLKNNDSQSAWSILNRYPIGDLSFSSFLEYYLSVGNWKKVMDLWKMLQNYGLLDKSLSLVVKAMVLSGMTDEIDNIANRISPNSHPKTARNLIMYYLRTSKVEKAEKLLLEMSYVKSVPEKAYSITEFILHYSKYSFFN